MFYPPKGIVHGDKHYVVEVTLHGFHGVVTKGGRASSCSLSFLT